MRARAAIVVSVVAAASCPATVLAAAGGLDPSFSGNGKVVTGFPELASTEWLASGIDVAVSDDRRIAVLAGLSNITDGGAFGVVRYLPDGSLDRSFHGDGRRLFFGGVNFTELAVREDGRIVLLGWEAGTMVLAGLDTDGSFDRSFGHDGIRQVSFGAPVEGGSIGLLDDGRIVAAAGSREGFAVARFEPDGSLDDTFDGNGKTLLRIDGATAVSGLAVAPDGGVVVAGGVGRTYSLRRVAVARFRSDGSPEGSFRGGVVTPWLWEGRERARDVALQPDDRVIVVVTGDAHGFAGIRFDADGSLDRSFGREGRRVVRFGADGESGHGIALQPDGRIIAVGNVQSDWTHDFAAVRLTSKGRYDSIFGDRGRVVTSIRDGSSAEAVALQGDGKVVATGHASLSEFQKVAVVRYLAS